MQKLTLILLIIIWFNDGCFVLRKKTDSGKLEADKVREIDFLKAVKDNNVTKRSFFIKRADIEFSNDDLSQNFYASLKYLKQDTLLLSIRSRIGIEIARIFMTNDTLLINDRINRKLLVGNPGYIEDRYGIAAPLINGLIGDLMLDNKTENDLIRCLDSKFIKESLVNGHKIKYVIDCKLQKVVNTLIESSLETKRIVINYKEFKRKDQTIFPKIIEVKDLENNSRLKIKIIKIETNWQGSIEFIPGYRYKVIQLL